MFVPLVADVPLRRRPVVTRTVIAVTCLVWLAALPLTGSFDLPEAWVARFAGAWNPTQPWRLVTYSLLHAGVMHLAGNMIVLWVFGPPVEDRLGRVRFVLLYVLGGAAAAGAHLLSSGAPLVGASGAVAAVSGAFLVLFPRSTIRTFVLFIVIGVYHIPAAYFIAFAIAKDFLLRSSGGPVGHVAHLGGYAFGIASASALLFLKVVPREPFNLLYLVRQAARRREMAISPPAPAPATARAGEAARSALSAAVDAGRAEVLARLKARDMEGARGAYRALVALAGPGPALARRQHLELISSLLEAGDGATAASACEAFLGSYPRDAETPHVHLLLALIWGRKLGHRTKAQAALDAAGVDFTDPDQADLARALRAELGGPAPAGG